MFDFLRFFVEKYKDHKKKKEEDEKVEKDENNNSNNSNTENQVKVATVNIRENAIQVQSNPPSKSKGSNIKFVLVFTFF